MGNLEVMARGMTVAEKWKELFRLTEPSKAASPLMSYSYLGQKTLVYDDWTKMIFGPDRFGYPKFFNESIFLNVGLKIPLNSIKNI